VNQGNRKVKSRVRAKWISKAVGVRWDSAELAVTPKEMMLPVRTTLTRNAAVQSQSDIYWDR